MTFKEQLAHRLILLRHLHNFTQEEIGDKIGVTRYVISHWESGATSAISPENIAKLAQTYKVSSDYILGLKDGVLK